MCILMCRIQGRRRAYLWTTECRSGAALCLPRLCIRGSRKCRSPSRRSKPRSAGLHAGTALCTPRNADLLAGAALCSKLCRFRSRCSALWTAQCDSISALCAFIRVPQMHVLIHVCRHTCAPVMYSRACALTCARSRVALRMSYVICLISCVCFRLCPVTRVSLNAVCALMYLLSYAYVYARLCAHMWALECVSSLICCCT